MFQKITVLLIFFLLSFSTQASSSLIWSCGHDLRSQGQDFESVEIHNHGLTNTLIFNYIPNPQKPELPAIENKVLVEDLRCRFYAAQKEIIQCVSTDFTRFVETELLPSESTEGPQKIRISIQSDLLHWPADYGSFKNSGMEEFIIDFPSSTSFCGPILN